MANTPKGNNIQLIVRFVRCSGARTGGLGLGLSIVRGFAVAQGGDVAIGANPGGGAEITIYLPHSTQDIPHLDDQA